MKERNVVLILVMVLVVACTVQAQVIISADRAGGASGDRSPIGVYTGDSNSLPTEAGGLIAGNYVFSDRDYLWMTPPAQLNGVEYIRTFNSDKGTSATYTVTTSMAARLFIGIDDRFDDPQAIADGIVANFASAGTFTPAGYGPTIAGDGHTLFLYWRDMDPNTYVFQSASSGNNYNTIGAIDPAMDPLPQVDAGPGGVVWNWPATQLNGSVDDADPLDGPAGTLTYGWTEDAGNPTLGVIDDPGALTSGLSIVPVSGDEYTFTLWASDDGGTTTVEDSVTITFKVFGVDKQTVLLVSAVVNEPGHAEEPLIAWLEGLGYAVDTAGMGQAFGEDDNALNSGDDGHPAFLAATGGADIIFFSVSCRGQEYDGDGGEHIWNEIPVPLITQSAEMTEGDNSGGDTTFGWTLEDSRGDDDFDEMRLPPDFNSDRVRLWDFTDATNRADVVMIESMPIADGGVIRATVDNDSRPFWVEFPAGTSFDLHHDPAVAPGKYGIAAADRVFFGAYEYAYNNEGGSATRGPNGGQAYWDSFILPVYKTYLQQILFDLAPDPTFNPPPNADAGPKQAIYLDETDTVTLAGTVTDDDPIDGTPGTLTSYWAKYSGPGTVTFDPADTTDQLAPDATFGASGRYELLLTVSDGTKDANDVVVIVVQDKELVGHWPFDGDAIDASVNSNDGTLAELEEGYPKYDTDAAIGSHSIALADPNASDPNQPHVYLGDAPELDMQSVPVQFTASAWIKTTNTDTQVIIQKGADSGGGIRWMLRTSGGNASIITDDNDDKETATGGYVADGLWHFVLATCEDDGSINIYVDGVFQDDDTGHASDYDLSGTSQKAGRIGAGTDFDMGPDEVNGKVFDGNIDDVRVYNYALSEADILDLADDGPLVANVDAGPDEPSFPWKLGPPDRLYQLNGVVTDNGLGGVGDTLWSTEVGPPDGLGGEYEASFTNFTDPNSKVSFPAAGDYTLRLTVIDTAPAVTVWDTVVITAVPPTCAEVLADGLGMPGDIAGGGLLGDEPDCYVNLVDLVAILANWPACNVPLDPSCDWPF